MGWSRWAVTLRGMIVPVIAAFLSFLLIVIRPVSRLGGEYAFLTYTSILLFFFPRGGIVNQLECTIFGILGAALGQAWCCVALAIAAYCGRTYGADSDQARAVIGLGLGILALVCGFVKSYRPQLVAAANITLFFPIFHLTSRQDITVLTSNDFLDPFYVALFAAVCALLPTLLLPRKTASHQLASTFATSTQAICDLIPLSLASILELEEISEDHERGGSSDIEAAKASMQLADHAKQGVLAKTLKANLKSLQAAHLAYSREFTKNPLPAHSLLPIIEAIIRLQRNPLLGPTSHVPGERIRAALERTYDKHSRPPTIPGTPIRRGRTSWSPEASRGNSPIALTSMSTGAVPPDVLRTALGNVSWSSSRLRSPSMATLPKLTSEKITSSSGQLVTCINEAIRAANIEVARIYHWSTTSVSASTDLKIIQSDLDFALLQMQKQLSTMLDGIPAYAKPKGSTRNFLTSMKFELFNEAPTPPSPTPYHGQTGNKDHFRLAFYMTALVDLAKETQGLLHVVSQLQDSSDGPPRWHTPRIPFLIFSRAQSTISKGPNDTNTADIDAVPDDAAEAGERHLQSMDFVTATLHHHQAKTVDATSLQVRAELAWRKVWDHRSVLRARVMLSRLLHHIRHSKHVLFAIKMSAGVSLLALPAFLPASTRGRTIFYESRGAWAVVSYMYVLEVHTGATLKIGVFRTIGTFIGALTAFVCSLIAQDNPYALVVLATAISVPITYGVLYSRYPPIATISGITLPPIMFITYLDLGGGRSQFDLAWMRFTDIVIGIAAAVAVGTLVWPNHARVRFLHAVAGSLEKVIMYYLNMSRDNLRSSLVYQADSKRYNRLEEDLRQDLQVSRNLIEIQRKEISLLPRPIRLYSETVDATERLLDILNEVRVLRFSVPRKATVLDVLPIRREFVSSVLINLWACSQAFMSRAPLPQYLPSPHIPLDELIEAIDDHARRARSGSSLYSSPVDGLESSAFASGRDSRVQSELAILYGMAEGEALRDLCNIIDELVAATRILFGSQTFLDPTQSFMG